MIASTWITLWEYILFWKLKKSHIYPFLFSREEYFCIATGGVEPVRIKPSYVFYGQLCDMHMGEKGVREGVVDI